MNTIVVVGVAVSLGLVVVSAMLNFRMGYRAADTEMDGWVYGLGAGFGDGLKAIAPFVMAWGWKHRDGLAVVAAVVVFAVFSITSMTAAIGFAAQHRAVKQAERQGGAEHHGDLRRQLERAENRLGQLGMQRSSGEVAKAVAAALKRPIGDGRRTVGEISEQCTLNRKSTRESCAAIAELGQERARAEEAERLEERVRELRRSLDQVKGRGGEESADPQVDALLRLAGLVMAKVEKKDVQFALALLLAFFIELGSSVGLYVCTTPWRSGAAEGRGRQEHRRWRSRMGGKPGEAGVGSVERYALERLEPLAGSHAGATAMFADYQAWCLRRGDVAHGRREFARLFGQLADEAGMRSYTRGRETTYVDIKLMEGRGRTFLAWNLRGKGS